MAPAINIPLLPTPCWRVGSGGIHCKGVLLICCITPAMGVGDRSASLLDDHSQEKVRVIKYQLTSSRDTQRPMSDGGKAAPRALAREIYRVPQVQRNGRCGILAFTLGTITTARLKVRPEVSEVWSTQLLVATSGLCECEAQPLRQ